MPRHDGNSTKHPSGEYQVLTSTCSSMSFIINMLCGVGVSENVVVVGKTLHTQGYPFSLPWPRGVLAQPRDLSWTGMRDKVVSACVRVIAETVVERHAWRSSMHGATGTRAAPADRRTTSPFLGRDHDTERPVRDQPGLLAKSLVSSGPSPPFLVLAGHGRPCPSMGETSLGEQFKPKEACRPALPWGECRASAHPPGSP